MPQDLPGFYYDVEKKRYFPIKGPIPGSSKKYASTQKLDSQSIQAKKLGRRKRKVPTLLCERELYGQAVLINKRKRSFQEEYRNFQASQPLVWKYQGTELECDEALGLVHVYMQTGTGIVGSSILLTGTKNGGVSLLDVGRAGEDIFNGEKLTAKLVFPNTVDSETEWAVGSKDIWRLNDESLCFASSISSICTTQKETWSGNHDALGSESALFTTLGSELVGGQVFFLKFDANDLIEEATMFPRVRRLHQITTLNCTIWDSDCNFDQNKSVVGTNLGATLVNLPNGVSSTLCLCKSDVLSVQFIQQGNVVLCGLRNGTILTLDIRERQRPLPKHNISFPPGESSTQRGKRFSVSGSISPACTAFMPSSISSLAPLKLYDQYFLASSKDGSINLFDHRLTQRGAVQSYEGNVNTHSRIQLGVDPYERCVVSGGEDQKVRLWSIKSGEMLFEEKFASSVPSSFLSMGSQYMSGNRKSLLGNLGYSGGGSSWGAWVGSSESLFWMQFQ